MSQRGQRVGRQRPAFRGAELGQPVGRLAQPGLEAAEAEADERGLDAVGDARLLADQRLALAARLAGDLLGERRHRRHGAMAGLAAQPAEEAALEQLGVEPIGLRPAMGARHGHAGRVDDMRLDAACPQPAGQPEAVATGLVGDRDAADRPPRPRRLVPPAMQQPKQRLGVGLQLLRGLALEPGHQPGDQPARLAQLDDRDHRAILIQGDGGLPRVIRSRHGALHRRVARTTMVTSLAARPIASEEPARRRLEARGRGRCDRPSRRPLRGLLRANGGLGLGARGGR